MSSCPDEINIEIRRTVDEQPIWFHMALFTASIVPSEVVIPMLLRERLFVYELIHDVDKLFHAFAAVFPKLIVLFKLCL